jgi:alpha-L-fucosidase
MNDLNFPLAQYAQVANSFNPTLFNADQWVQIAKNAGMQYMVITSKHHDGFSMFPTSVNTYNIADATPFGRDPLAELSTAARAAGLHFGVYYSILNWADPNASAAGIGTYMQTMETQLRELVTHYDPGILWFDGEWPTWWTDEDGRELEEFIRNINPSIIINNRVGKRLSTDGDFDTPEQVIPAGASPGRLWETAMTLNDTWGYKDTDNDWKSPTTVIGNLADIVSKGGNFILNVGPTGQGIIPAPSVQILQTVGSWLSANGEAIYGAGLAPVAPQTWGSIIEKGNAEYAIVFNWPSSGVLHVPVPATAWRAELLNGSSLSFTTSSGAIDITIPTTMPSQPATVIRIDLVPPGTAVITGQVFNDANNNGARDPGETGLAGATVFLDANHNGALDPGEISTTTDAAGNYAFVGLLPGSYVVSEIAPTGYRRTTTYSVPATVAANRVASGPLFGNVQASTVPMNFAYLLLLAQHYTQPATFATGDLNDDGLVNFDDLLLLIQNYGHPIL